MAKMRNRSKSLHTRIQPLESDDEDSSDNGTQGLSTSLGIKNKRETEGTT